MKTCSIFIHICDSYVFRFVCMIIRSTQSMRANMMNDDVNELLVFSLSLSISFSTNINMHQLCWMKFNHRRLVFIESSRFGALFFYCTIEYSFNPIETGNHFSERFIVAFYTEMLIDWRNEPLVMCT